MLLGRLFHAADVVSISRLPRITVLFLLGTSDVVGADHSVLYSRMNVTFQIIQSYSVILKLFKVHINTVIFKYVWKNLF